ncbi:DrmB family protein [Blastococcus sp. SYSU D00669]
MSRFQYTPLRRAHAIAPFGPGALTLTRDRVSAVVCGPATWLRSLPSRPGATSILDELTITDRHLQKATGVDRFVMPWAAADEPSKTADWVIPAVRFPLTEACSNIDCQTMVRRIPGDAGEGRCDACASGRRRRWPTFQTAVVQACPAGHLDDVDWGGWLHAQPGDPCPGEDLQYRPGSTADRPQLHCRGCGRRETFEPDTDFPCTGARPWLPHAGPEGCRLRARPLERTSTSAYYAWQLSSLTIPVAGADNPALLHALTDNPTLRTLRGLPRSVEVTNSMVEVIRAVGIATDTAEVLRHLDALDADHVTDPSRAEELTALQSEDHPRRPTGALPDLVVAPQDVAQYRGSRLGRQLSGVSLVPRLRETRVLTGFSRLEPAAADVDAGYLQLWGKQRPETFAQPAEDDWLPGYQVFGEGILCVLDNNAVDHWISRVDHDPRLLAAARAAAGQTERPQRPLAWLLAHTLAHLLMRAAAPHAGYALPSLRERIFATDQRTAFLVYTAAGDVHGTLGGLVELGTPDRLGELLETAADAALWCATDPVCGEDDGAPRGRGSEPGACHHCLLVPETSCEAFNHGLDRAAVVGHGEVPGFLAGTIRLTVPGEGERI